MTDGTGPACVLHPAVSATLSCERCGDFVCETCLKEIVGRKVCASCIEVEGVDYLEEFKQENWGKRDGFVWLFGGLGSLGALFNLVILARVPAGIGALIPLVVVGLSLGINLSYFFLRRWARVGIIILPFLACGGASLLLYLQGGAPLEIGRQAGAYVIPLLIAAAAYRSARNRLAFKIEVSEAALAKLYETYDDNRAARNSLFLGVLSLVVPPLILGALPLGIVGLRRVDPEAWPPVGGRGRAIAGITLSCLALVGYGTLLVILVLR